MVVSLNSIKSLVVNSILSPYEVPLSLVAKALTLYVVFTCKKSSKSTEKLPIPLPSARKTESCIVGFELKL